LGEDRFFKQQLFFSVVSVSLLFSVFSVVQLLFCDAGRGGLTKTIMNLWLKVKENAPSHCSGEKAIELFKGVWGDNFIESGCGVKIKISLDNKNN
jgi:hypothetical protein